MSKSLYGCPKHTCSLLLLWSSLLLYPPNSGLEDTMDLTLSRRRVRRRDFLLNALQVRVLVRSVSYLVWRCINPICSSPPLDIFRDKSATRVGLAARFHEFFPCRVAHILRPNLWRSGARLWSYVTFNTCMSTRKSLNFVILCTKPMQILIFEVIHITTNIFTFDDWIWFISAR